MFGGKKASTDFGRCRGRLLRDTAGSQRESCVRGLTCQPGLEGGVAGQQGMRPAQT